MTDIGSQLRMAREAKGLTIEQAFKATRIKLSFLEAIEANQLSALPGPVQARGFVRSYANYLGLDGEHLASLLDAPAMPALEVRPVSVGATPTRPLMVPRPGNLPSPASKPTIVPPVRPTAAPVESPAEPPRLPLRVPTLALNSARPSAESGPGSIPTWVLIVGAAALFIIGAILVISALTSAGQSPKPVEPLNVPNSIGGVSTSDRFALAPTGSGPVSITVRANEHVWTRITLDGQTAFEGMLAPNSVKDWQAAAEIIVETGNAAALTVIHDGQESVLGGRGQIVARAWRHDGVSDVPPAVSSRLTPPTGSVATNTVR